MSNYLKFYLENIIADPFIYYYEKYLESKLDTDSIGNADHTIPKKTTKNSETGLDMRSTEESLRHADYNQNKELAVGKDQSSPLKESEKLGRLTDVKNYELSVYSKTVKLDIDSYSVCNTKPHKDDHNHDQNQSTLPKDCPSSKNSQKYPTSSILVSQLQSSDRDTDKHPHPNNIFELGLLSDNVDNNENNNDIEKVTTCKDNQLLQREPDSDLNNQKDSVQTKDSNSNVKPIGNIQNKNPNNYERNRNTKPAYNNNDKNSNTNIYNLKAQPITSNPKIQQTIPNDNEQNKNNIEKNTGAEIVDICNPILFKQLPKQNKDKTNTNVNAKSNNTNTINNKVIQFYNLESDNTQTYTGRDTVINLNTLPQQDSPQSKTIINVNYSKPQPQINTRSVSIADKLKQRKEILIDGKNNSSKDQKNNNDTYTERECQIQVKNSESQVNSSLNNNNNNTKSITNPNLVIPTRKEKLIEKGKVNKHISNITHTPSKSKPTGNLNNSAMSSMNKINNNSIKMNTNIKNSGPQLSATSISMQGSQKVKVEIPENMVLNANREDVFERNERYNLTNKYVLEYYSRKKKYDSSYSNVVSELEIMLNAKKVFLPRFFKIVKDNIVYISPDLPNRTRTSKRYYYNIEKLDDKKIIGLIKKFSEYVEGKKFYDKEKINNISSRVERICSVLGYNLDM